MLTTIPLIMDSDARQKEQWLFSLQQKLPAYRVKLAEDCSEIEKSVAEVAVVYNPDPALVREFTALKWVQSLWAGVDGLLELPEFAKIAIARMIDPLMSQAMAEAVMAWSLYLHRDMPHYLKLQRQKRWQPMPYTPAQDRKIGILGCGELGLAAIGKLIENHFTLSGWSRSPKQIKGAAHYHGQPGLTHILQESDILICLLPLTPATHHLLDLEKLSLMKSGACLINFARGAIIDTNALISLLDKQHIQHAVLDVFETEPLPEDSPLWVHPAVTILPHISAPSSVESTSVIAAANLQRWLQNGIVPPTVDRRQGY